MHLTGLLILLSFAAFASTQTCPSPNGYFPDPAQCDAYTECKEGVAEKQLCPEGLMFNDRLTGYPRYPCSYPQEVDCGQRRGRQPAKPTPSCPHQYGMFRSETESCSSFTNCVGGIGHPHQCPEGLAFNPANLQCDWPDQVPSCENLLHFTCPGVRVDADLGHPRFADEGDCRKFYVCVEGMKPRMHQCGVGFVFNDQLGVCDEPNNVPKCSNYYPKEVLDAIQKLRQFDNRLL